MLAKTPDLQHSETDGAEDPEWSRKRALERAAKRFQLVTKEEDWRIANAYVAIASSSSPDPQPDKEKSELVAGRASSSSLTKRTANERRMGEPDPNGASASTTARAVDAYLDDDEWEAEQLAAGRRPSSAYLLSSTSRLPSSSKSGEPSTRLGRWTWASRPAGSHENQA